MKRLKDFSQNNVIISIIVLYLSLTFFGYILDFIRKTILDIIDKEPSSLTGEFLFLFKYIIVSTLCILIMRMFDFKFKLNVTIHNKKSILRTVFICAFVIIQTLAIIIEADRRNYI